MTDEQKMLADRRGRLLDEMRDLNDAGRVLVSLMDLILEDSKRPFVAPNFDREAFQLVSHAHHHVVNTWSAVNRKLMDGYGLWPMSKDYE